MKAEGFLHFITAIGFDDTYIYANDPNSKTIPRKQAASKFQKCMKRAFLFWPTVKESEPEPEPEPSIGTPAPALEPATPATPSGATGDKIIDISKWQGKINFDKVAKEVAFVIARAGVGSDPDPKFDEYAKAMKDRNIPFGVYCYSYAGDAAKARDEAQKLVQRTAKYNPLFWVMDAEEAKITTEAIRTFANELRNQGAERIGCYCAHHRYKEYNYDSLRSLWNFTWIPCYGSNNGTIEGSKKPSYICDLWQYTSTAKVAGISGNCDVSVITGQGKSLEWFLNNDGNTATPSAPVEQPVASTQKVFISGGDCYIRSQPNTSGSIKGVAYSGDTFEYGGETASNGWLSIIHNGQICYVSNKYGRLV